MALPASTFTPIYYKTSFFDRTVPHAYGDSPWLYKYSDHLQISSYAVKSGLNEAVSKKQSGTSNF